LSSLCSDAKTVPEALANACITSQGKLTPGYEYIEKYRRVNMLQRTVQEAEPSKEMLLRGHLFDSRFINQALDTIEYNGGHFEIVDAFAAPNKVDKKKISQVSQALCMCNRPTARAPTPCGGDRWC
jgi:hypothetical protein